MISTDPAIFEAPDLPEAEEIPKGSIATMIAGEVTQGPETKPPPKSNPPSKHHLPYRVRTRAKQSGDAERKNTRLDQNVQTNQS